MGHGGMSKRLAGREMGQIEGCRSRNISHSETRFLKTELMIVHVVGTQTVARRGGTVGYDINQN